MTPPSPKEKAVELYHKFAKQWHISTYEVKKNALIHVNEIIYELKEFHNQDGYANSRIEYYQEVKQELEKL